MDGHSISRVMFALFAPGIPLPSSFDFRMMSIHIPDKMRSITRAAVQPYVCASCRYGIRAGSRRFSTNASQTPEIYDVVCVGGGPAGLGLLAALRK